MAETFGYKIVDGSVGGEMGLIEPYLDSGQLPC